jgi:CheY-like chemotaxis protein
MKKVLIADALKSQLTREKSFLNRADVKLLTASTNDDILAVHRAEKVNLIISQLDMPGMESDRLYAAIRRDGELRKVSLIMLCNGRPGERERAQQCTANAVMARPVDTALLLEKAQELLDISWRESYRVLLSVNVTGTSTESAFFCRSENISSTGLLVETDRELKEGDRVVCSFFLPGSRQIIAPGEIVRSTEAAQKSGQKRYGVKFEKLTAEARSTIEAFIMKKRQ